MVPMSTRASSLIVSVESDAMLMSDWKEVITQPSSARAAVPETVTAHAAAMAAIAKRAARVVMGVLTQIRRQCYATYYAAVRYLVAASGNPTRCFVGLERPDRPQERARVRNPQAPHPGRRVAQKAARLLRPEHHHQHGGVDPLPGGFVHGRLGVGAGPRSGRTWHRLRPARFPAPRLGTPPDVRVGMEERSRRPGHCRPPARHELRLVGAETQPPSRQPQ